MGTDYADLVFRGGDVYTVDAARSWVRAVAVRDGSIVATGTDDELDELIGSGTEVVDLAGRMLIPGFQDAHVHPVQAGVERLQCDLREAHSQEGYLAITAAYASDHPDVAWILGGGWSMDVFPGGTPTKESLDSVVADRPVFFPNRDGHGGWVNSAALRIAGITRDTPDPVDGRIERNADGEPSGTLHEGAMDLLAEHLPMTTKDEFRAGLREGQAHLHALGITAWQDAIVSKDFAPVDVYAEAAANGTLTARVVGALWWERTRGLEQIDDLIEQRETGAAGRFAPTSVKIMVDGVCENFTAAVLDPYLDQHGEPTDNRGICFVDPEELKVIVTRLDAEGFQVHFHSLADRAVRAALDAIEAARDANGPSTNRHHLSHIQVVHPDDIPRFRRLGAVANAQALWAAHEPQMDELTIPFLGEPRWRWQYPFASLHRSGAMLAMGSDWSVSSADPLEEIHVAVNRSGPPGQAADEPFIPEERLDLATSIAAFTMGSAYVNHLDDVTGSIEVGKQADLAIVDRNLFAHPAEEISASCVEGTYVAGEQVWPVE